MVVLDLGLPDASGVEVTQGILQARPEARVLILSASGEQQDVLDAVKAGAAGYLLKSAARAEFLDAVRRTAAGDAVFTPGLAGLVLGEFRRLAAGSSRAGRPSPQLTEREAEILRMVATGLSYKQIAERLVLSHRTVQNHVQNTLAKLHLHNRVELVRYAIEHGLDDSTPLSMIVVKRGAIGQYAHDHEVGAGARRLSAAPVGHRRRAARVADAEHRHRDRQPGHGRDLRGGLRPVHRDGDRVAAEAGRTDRHPAAEQPASGVHHGGRVKVGGAEHGHGLGPGQQPDVAAGVGQRHRRGQPPGPDGQPQRRPLEPGQRQAGRVIPAGAAGSALVHRPRSATKRGSFQDSMLAWATSRAMARGGASTQPRPVSWARSSPGSGVRS